MSSFLSHYRRAAGPVFLPRDWGWTHRTETLPSGSFSLDVSTLHSVLWVSIPSFPLLFYRTCAHRLSGHDGVQEVRLKGRSLQKFINKLLSEPSHTHSLTHCLVASGYNCRIWVFARKITWPATSKRITILSFTENVPVPLDLEVPHWL